MRTLFYRPKHLAHAVGKFASKIDHGIMQARRTFDSLSPAILAGTAAVAPQALPGVTGVVSSVTGALNTYDRIRSAIKNK